ncbi:hypothetical protein ACFYO7_10655 [Nocardia salmonicida]|uniref:hypothetical protein n=1 Tax=Nocardia salmonicida TaxID=53431 RepID=UPI003679ECCD
MAAVAKLHADNGSVQALAVHGALDADPRDPFVDSIADAVLNCTSPFPRSADYETVKILSHLVDGLTPDNFVQRGRLLASKTRRKAKDESEKAAFRWLGAEALGLEMLDRPQTLPLFAHHLSRMISIAPQHNLSFDELWGWVKKIEGEVGDRLRSQVLATATDQHLADAITHVATRIKSALTTAEDLTLVNSIMDRNPPRTTWNRGSRHPQRPQPGPTRMPLQRIGAGCRDGLRFCPRASYTHGQKRSTGCPNTSAAPTPQR